MSSPARRLRRAPRERPHVAMKPPLVVLLQVEAVLVHHFRRALHRGEVDREEELGVPLGDQLLFGYVRERMKAG